ncbi:MAG: OmpA family protein [Planctomycetia bacterium]|nr:OmpA family protein [Planctomycetia bacterium]
MAGGGGGAWKVAYADFVTAMMAFFLVMWIVAQNKPVKEAIAGYFRDPTGSGLMTGGQGFMEGGAARSKSGSDSKKNGGGRVPSLAMIQSGAGTTVGASVLFGEQSVDLDEPARDRLKDILPLMIGRQTKIEIRAHVVRSSQAAGGEKNETWKTCYDRCLAVMNFLEQKGIDRERFRLSQAGPYEPQATTKDPQWRKRNSRVEVIMLNEYVDDYDKNREQTTTVANKKQQLVREPVAHEPEPKAKPAVDHSGH